LGTSIEVLTEITGYSGKLVLTVEVRLRIGWVTSFSAYFAPRGQRLPVQVWVASS
jgi:hypothetical protein